MRETVELFFSKPPYVEWDLFPYRMEPARFLCDGYKEHVLELSAPEQIMFVDRLKHIFTLCY